VEREWPNFDVGVIQAPVAAGKSHTLDCVARWAGQGTIAVPSNLEVAQYTRQFGDRQAPRYRGGMTEQTWRNWQGEWRNTPQRVTNNYSYLALRSYAPLVCFDEAHRLVGMMRDLDAFRIWHHLVPEGLAECETVDQLLYWAMHNRGSHKSVDKLVDKLGKHPDTFCTEHTVEPYRGQDRDVTKVMPLTGRTAKPVLWPRSVKKLILASATFTAEDVYDLGLERRRVMYFSCDSPIAPDRRPVVYDPVGSMSYSRIADTWPYLIDKLEHFLTVKQGKGMIHATYDIAERLAQSRLADHPRIRFHTRRNKSAKFSEWRAGVLVGCGLSEAIDLAGPDFQWQVITKIMYPSQADSAVLAQMQARPAWYQWQAVKDFLQAVGRICRSPTDFGETIVLDNCFSMLYNKNQSAFPQYVKDSIRWKGGSS
jgi:hypothetical protein